jgi:hypothetical protein
MAQSDRDPVAGFAAIAWAYRIPIPRPILAFADLEKPAAHHPCLGNPLFSA